LDHKLSNTLTSIVLVALDDFGSYQAVHLYYFLGEFS